jgi:uncharacterized protein (DUF302 family)
MLIFQSSFGPEETMNRFECEVRARGMTVFAHIDHAAGAASVNMSLRPTELLIFGSVKAGTPLMDNVQSIAIDLPLKAIVWQDDIGATWLGYNDPRWIMERHRVDVTLAHVIVGIAEVLQQMAAAATGT